MDTKNLIDMRTTAKIIGVTPQRVSQLVKSKKLKPTVLGNKFFFNRSEVEKLKRK